jgi:hypothetical protein
MHIIERYYFVDDQGKEHRLKCECTRSLETLGKQSKALEETRTIVDEEILAELKKMNYYKKPWWKVW